MTDRYAQIGACAEFFELRRAEETADSKRDDLAFVAVVGHEFLARLLQLPEGSYVDYAHVPHDLPGELYLRVRGAGWPVSPGKFLAHSHAVIRIDQAALRKRLHEAMEGELDGLAISDDTADKILDRILAAGPHRGALYTMEWGLSPQRTGPRTGKA